MTGRSRRRMAWPSGCSARRGAGERASRRRERPRRRRGAKRRRVGARRRVPALPHGTRRAGMNLEQRRHRRLGQPASDDHRQGQQPAAQRRREEERSQMVGAGPQAQCGDQLDVAATQPAAAPDRDADQEHGCRESRQLGHNGRASPVASGHQPQQWPPCPRSSWGSGVGTDRDHAAIPSRTSSANANGALMVIGDPDRLRVVTRHWPAGSIPRRPSGGR